MARQYYTTVDLGNRALLVRSAHGGGFTKVADCRSMASATRIAQELNEVQCVHISVVREAVRLLGLATTKSIAEAAEMLRLAAGSEEE